MRAPHLRLLIGLFCILATSGLNAQKILWQKAIGGSGYDNGLCLIPADHGCFYIGGITNSTDGFGKGHFGPDKYDMFVTKVSAEGQVIWRTLLGGTANEEFGQLRITPDSGLVVIGTTMSTDEYATTNHGKMDMLVCRLDRFGRVIWSRCYGGLGNDKGFAIEPLDDGGYLIGGESGSRTGTMTYHHGGLDAWVARLDAAGDVKLEKSLGGRGNETVTRFLKLKKDRFLTVCTTNSVDGDMKEFMGEKDVWIACLSKNFDIVWQRAFGGSMFDEVHDIIQTKRGSLILAGTTFSSDQDLDGAGYNGLGDAWMMKISEQGNLAWSRCYGGSKSEGANAVAETPDGGLILVGTTNSKDKIVPGSKGLYDGLIVRTDSNGKAIWTGTFGGEDFEYLHGVLPLSKGNYLGVGFAESSKGDLLPTGKLQGNDVWMLRFSDPEDATDNALRSQPYLTGLVYSAEDGSPLPAKVVVSNNDNISKFGEARCEGDGRYELNLPKSGKYSVMYSAQGYMFYGEDLDLSLLATGPEIRIDAKLEPIKVGSKIILKLIYFETGKWELRSESDPEMRRLEIFLKANPNVKIEISGHTDDSGSPGTKKELSENRATKVRDWLLKAGVPGRQMQVMGYGMDRPIADNKSEDGRAKNRRVEIEVVEIMN